MAYDLLMTSSWQTISALLIVGLAATWLVRMAMKKGKTPGCGSEGCGALSPDARALRKKLRKG
ncbi:MAG: hypothetical protein PHE83_02970 [Opitutaceae bacterium]|nr:hypothetical protein [Opitutaceae bacterium]